MTKLSEGRFKSNEEINILYDDLARTVMDQPDRFSFLADVVPLKSHIYACFPKEEDGDVEGKGAAMANGSLGGGDGERAPGAVGMEPATTPPSPPPPPTSAVPPTMPTSLTTAAAAVAEPRVAEGGPQGHG